MISCYHSKLRCQLFIGNVYSPHLTIFYKRQYVAETGLFCTGRAYYVYEKYVFINIGTKLAHYLIRRTLAKDDYF